jgi:hypothetical protein
VRRLETEGRTHPLLDFFHIIRGKYSKLAFKSGLRQRAYGLDVGDGIRFQEAEVSKRHLKNGATILRSDGHMHNQRALNGEVLIHDHNCRTDFPGDSHIYESPHPVSETWCVDDVQNFLFHFARGQQIRQFSFFGLTGCESDIVQRLLNHLLRQLIDFNQESVARRHIGIVWVNRGDFKSSLTSEAATVLLSAITDDT